MQKFNLALGLFLVLALSLAQFGCSTANLEPDKIKTLKVGILGPFSGRAASTGMEIRGAVELAFESVDYQINDYQVELVWIDSQSDAERATLAYEKAAAEEQIDACILNWHSNVAVAAMDVAARHKLPHFFGFGGTDIINEKFAFDPDYYSYFMAKSWPSPGKLTHAYVAALEEATALGYWLPPNKRVAIYGEDSEWGRSFARAIKNDFEAAGWEIAGEEYFPLGHTDLSFLVNRLLSLNASVIAGTASAAPSLQAFLSELRRQDSRTLIIADGLGWIGEWYELMGTDSNYILDQIPQWTKNEALIFSADFETKYGFRPSASAAGLTYDLTHFFIKIALETLQEYGEISRESLYEFGKTNLWSGEITYTNGIIMDEYAYTPDSIPDPVVGEGYFIFPVVQYYEGKSQIIWPADWREANFRGPQAN